MPNKPGNDDRSTTAGGIGDRGGLRDVSSDTARQNGSQQGSAAQSRTRSNRGFASMDRGKQREIASKGGKAAHAKGTAHEFDSGEAREAGRKGGVAVSRNREHMAAIGRRGGEARGQSRGRTGESPAESNLQSSRAGSMNSDRQVAINNQSEGVNANTLGNRGGTSSLGGERRPGSENTSTRNEERP